MSERYDDSEHVPDIASTGAAPAAGPWNYNLEEAPEDIRLLYKLHNPGPCGVPETWYRVLYADQARHNKYVVAWAIINTEGL